MWKTFSPQFSVQKDKVMVINGGNLGSEAGKGESEREG